MNCRAKDRGFLLNMKIARNAWNWINRLAGNAPRPKRTQGDLREDQAWINHDSLLGREPIRANEALIDQAVRGRSILVTGAGGSIGTGL